MSFFVETKGNIKKTELKWDFPDVTSLEWQMKNQGEAIKSPDFHADGDGDVKWLIELLPNGDSEDHKGWISAFLHPKIGPEYRSPVNAKFTFTAVSDKDGKKVWSRTMESTFGPDEPYQDGYGWSKIVKLADVLESNFFSLVCQLQYADPEPTTKMSVLPSSQVPLSNEELPSSLSQNLEEILYKRSGTDVCFIIKGKEIKAHKWILSARSPVFAAMVESGMKESVENRVEIDDIAPDIFEALLRFIYTDRVDLAQVDVQDLLVAANKYMIPLLKLECQKFLTERLTTENCVGMLALADLHNCVHLKRSALHFIRLHRDVIIQSDGWKNLKQSRPELVIDVLESLLH